MEKGLDLQSKRNLLYFIKGDRIIMTRDLYNWLYFLRVKILGEKEMNACKNTQNLQLWHERFAHQNKSGGIHAN